MKIKYFSILALLLIQIILPPAINAANPKAPDNLRTCDKPNPTGTDNKPYFGWYVNDPDDNEIQTGYQILVASSEAILSSGKGDVWDSGKINSRSQNCIEIGGKALSPATRYYGKEMTGTEEGNYILLKNIGSGTHVFERASVK